MRELTTDDFRKLRGQAIKIDTTIGAIDLKLMHVQDLPASGRAGGSFRLEFHGPLQPFLPQGTYVFHLGRERPGIFMVPLGPTGDAIRYEAIFY